jgi:hypothetical protein
LPARLEEGFDQRHAIMRRRHYRIAQRLPLRPQHLLDRRPAVHPLRHIEAGHGVQHLRVNITISTRTGPGL